MPLWHLPGGPELEERPRVLNHLQHRHPDGARNRTIATMMREWYAACVMRVFSCATAPAQAHYETMAFARSCTDKHLNRDHLPKAMPDRLQCTALGHPMKLSEPTAAANAAITPLTLQAGLHTISMMRPDGCEWA